MTFDKHFAEELCRRAFREFEQFSEEETTEAYQRLGGLASLGAHKTPQLAKTALVALLDYGMLSEELYLEHLFHAQAIDDYSIYGFARHALPFAEPHVYERVREISPDAAAFGIIIRAGAISVARTPPLEDFSRPLTVHEEHCSGGEHPPTVNCREVYLFEAPAYVESKIAVKAFLEKLSPSLRAAQEDVLTLKPFVQESYAESIFVRDDHWSSLAKLEGKRIISALAFNPLLPEGIAYELIERSKNPRVREAIAGTATSKELLEFIWNSTTSKITRGYVARNPVSGFHETIPEATLALYRDEKSRP